MNRISSRLADSLMLRGALAIVFSLFAFFMPTVTLSVLIVLFGVFVFVDGLFVLVSAIRGGQDGHPRGGWPTVVQGLVGVVIGIASWVVPGLTALWILYLMACWAILTGVLELVAAFRIRRDVGDDWLLVMTGAVSIVLGLAFMLMPGASLIAWIWTIGIYALISGIMMVTLSFRLRGRGSGSFGHGGLRPGMG